MTNDRFLHHIKVSLGGDAKEQTDQGGRNEITVPLEEAKGSLQHHQSPCENKMSNFTFRTESFSTDTLSTGLSLCRQLIPIKNFEHEGHLMLKKYPGTWEANSRNMAED